jgi:hypothetical protein
LKTFSSNDRNLTIDQSHDNSTRQCRENRAFSYDDSDLTPDDEERTFVVQHHHLYNDKDVHETSMYLESTNKQSK